MNDLSMSDPKTKLILGVTLLFIIAAVFYWFFIKPQFAQIQTLEKQITEKEQKLATLQLAEQRKKYLVDENKSLSNRIAVLQKVLPTERNEFLFGEEFQTVAKLCGVTIDTLSFPKKGVKNAPQNSVAFEISISANKFEKINWFLDHIAIFPQIININKISFSKGSGKYGGFTAQSGTSPQYTVDINGIIYLSSKK